MQQKLSEVSWSEAQRGPSVALERSVAVGQRLVDSGHCVEAGRQYEDVDAPAPAIDAANAVHLGAENELDAVILVESVVRLGEPGAGLLYTIQGV